MLKKFKLEIFTIDSLMFFFLKISFAPKTSLRIYCPNVKTIISPPLLISVPSPSINLIFCKFFILIGGGPILSLIQEFFFFFKNAMF